MDTIINKTRTFLGDTDPDNYTYTSDVVVNAIRVAIPIVEVDYPMGYECDEDTDVISPSPDASAEVLFALQAAIIILTGGAAMSSTEGIYVRDGDTAIDTTKGASAKDSMIKKLENRYNTLIDRLLDTDITGHRIDVYTQDFI